MTGALKLLEFRNPAMNVIYEKRPGGMLSMLLEPDADLKLAMQSAREHATKRGIPDAVCQVAVYLPGRKVIAGDEEVRLCFLLILFERQKTLLGDKCYCL